MKGMTADIFKFNGQSCSNGGLSATVDEVTIVSINGHAMPPIHEPDAKRPAVAIVTRECGGPYLTAYPCDPETGIIDKAGRMDGGCFIYSHDSRFRAIANYPVPLHDRKEY